MRVIQDFDTVLNISFSLMLAVYGTVATLGYYYFGSSAHTLLTTDLARNSPFTGHYFLLPGLTADKLVALSILLNAYSTYPSLVLVMQVSSYSHHQMVFKARMLHVHNCSSLAYVVSPLKYLAHNKIEYSSCLATAPWGKRMLIFSLFATVADCTRFSRHGLGALDCPRLCWLAKKDTL